VTYIVFYFIMTVIHRSSLFDDSSEIRDNSGFPPCRFFPLQILQRTSDSGQR